MRKLTEFGRISIKNFIATDQEEVVMVLLLELQIETLSLISTQKSEGVISLNEFRYNQHWCR
jgi:small subunit ribosomal protein S1